MLLNLTVKNFKSIQFTEVELKTFNALVGLNAAGKTNLIKAIDFSRLLALGKPIIEASNAIGGNIMSELSYGATTEITLKIGVAEKTFYLFEYHISLANQLDYRVSYEKLEYIKDTDRKLVYLREIKDIFDENNHKIPLQSSKDKLILSQYSNEHAAKLSGILDDYTIVYNLSAEIEMSDRLIDPKSYANPSIDSLAVRLYLQDEAAFSAAVMAIQRIIPNFVGPRIVPINVDDLSADSTTKPNPAEDNIKYYVTWREKDSKMSMNSRSLSNGNFRLIKLFLMMHLANPHTLLVVEEVENGLHYARIERLVDILRTLSRNLKLQLLITTHSTELLENMLNTEIFTCIKNSSGYSEYHRLENDDDKNKLSTTLKKDLGEILIDEHIWT